MQVEALSLQAQQQQQELKRGQDSAVQIEQQLLSLVDPGLQSLLLLFTLIGRC